MRTRGGRAPAGPWGRLKPTAVDPLESMGLPTRGDNRLLDFKAQEHYYSKIVERYMTFCSDAGGRDELLRRFSALDVVETTQPAPERPTRPSTSPSQRSAASSAGSESVSGSASQLPSPEDTKALGDVLAALRKLREGIVGSRRADEFAAQAYLFCIRLAVLVKHPPTYYPAILHLLRAFRPTLTSIETAEVVAYLVLDTACRRQNMAEAYVLRSRWALRDAKVDAALTALVHNNYVAFGRVKRSVDGHRARLLEFAEADMRTVALKCFGRAYHGVDLEFLEKCTGQTWDELLATDGVGWELDGSKVVIRSVKGR